MVGMPGSVSFFCARQSTAMKSTAQNGCLGYMDEILPSYRGIIIYNVGSFIYIYVNICFSCSSRISGLNYVGVVSPQDTPLTSGL